MNSNEQREKELIVGYDLCEDYSQISYFNYSLNEPKTISTTTGEERFQIPTVLFKREGLDKWYYGEEALKKSDNQDNVIKDILNKCRNNEVTVIETIEYKPEQLLEIFMKKTFGLFTYEGMINRIPDMIVFTIENVNANLVNAIKQSAKAIGIDKEKVYIQDHQESFVEYTINQKEELWNRDVVLLEYHHEYLKTFHLRISTKTTPSIATIEKKEYVTITNPQTMFLTDTIDDKNKKLDMLVRDALRDSFGKDLISCVFLCGDCFEGDWKKETLRFLCSGRRVFQGKNLCTKGACYKGVKKFLGDDAKDYLYLGENKLKYNIGLDLSIKGRNQYYNLIVANENWYDAYGECELILDNVTCIELKLTPIDNKDIRIIIINLHDLPQRPNKTIRILVQVQFESASMGKVTIKDLGFGEFYESSGMIWQHEIFL